MGRLSGKIGVIAGGNSGIGLATATAFVNEGARVAILGCDPTTLEAAVRGLGDPAIGVQRDVLRMRAGTHERFGSAEEIANAALFLATADSSFVLGHELVVDGGMSQL